MSFQDFGRKNVTQQRPASSNSTPYGGTGGSQKDVLSNISETLLQYQRNVGILEKIVQSLTASNNVKWNQSPELDAQYKAQIDVLRQLEDKIRRLLQQAPSTAAGGAQQTAWNKLQRDFDRVEARVMALQSTVERFKKQQHEQIAAKQASLRSTTAATAEATEAGDELLMMQLQVQQDRLAEEIMREREEEIRNINRGMHQVNEIYKDLAHIVGSQQESIDLIETQMEESKVNAQSGLKQVEKANEKYGNQCVIS